MELKRYQTRSLDALRVFLENAAIRPHDEAYRRAVEVGEPREYAGRYKPLPGLEEAPWCCLRLPTGGGKTLLGAYAVGIARDAFLKPRFPVVLWLTPTSMITSQTVSALSTPRHPYRQALENDFGGAVRVYDIEDRRTIRPQDMEDSLTIIVSTVQSFRITNMEDRNVYRDDEELEPHFASAASIAGLMVHESGPRKGRVICSFANLLKMHRPLMIVDEAHNFTSTLTGETIGRIAPSTIVEFTATPKRSNVICSASAAELKAEDMIKLPVHLTQHQSWEQAITHAVQNRAWLEEIATSDPTYIRPITLYQAQPKRDGAVATVEDVRNHLIKEEKIPEDQIAVATGTKRELEGIDLLSLSCPIRHIITVEALKEGWDCSFAYVFCSLATIREKGSVEQLLGRVLRMPFATRRASDELNRAYAHVSDRDFHTAASSLKDRLVDMGFDERTALEAIREMPQTEMVFAPGKRPDLKLRAPIINLGVRPDQKSWTPEMIAATTIVDNGLGGVTVTLSEDASDEAIREVTQSVIANEDEAATIAEAYIIQREASRTPAERGDILYVPQLALDEEGQAELVWPETLVNLGGWDLSSVSADLPGFALDETGHTASLDVEGDRIVIDYGADEPELKLDEATQWDASALSRWLDRTTKQADVAQPVFLEYCRRVVQGLVDRGISLAGLVRTRDTLRRAIIERIRQLRHQAGQRGVQMLMTELAPVLALGENGFAFRKGHYDPRIPYQGAWKPRKHFFPDVGDLKDKGEEYECAVEIDRHPSVKYWVRNVDRTKGAYWLPTSSDRFYPDFVAELTDGRILVMEYKGANLTDTEDSREKKNIGRRLQEISDGKVLFLWAERKNAVGSVKKQIDHAVKH